MPTGWACSGTFLSKFYVLQQQAQFPSVGASRISAWMLHTVGSERRIKVSGMYVVGRGSPGWQGQEEEKQDEGRRAFLSKLMPYPGCEQPHLSLSSLFTGSEHLQGCWGHTLKQFLGWRKEGGFICRPHSHLLLTLVKLCPRRCQLCLTPSWHPAPQGLLKEQDPCL